MDPLVTSMAATLGLEKNLTTTPTCSSGMMFPPFPPNQIKEYPF